MSTAGEDRKQCRHADDALLPSVRCVLRDDVLRDDIHRFATEITECVATLQQYRELAVRLQRVSAQVSRYGRRLAARRRVSET